MILRTPVPRKRRAESPPPGSSSDRHLVIYEDPAPLALDSSDHPSEQMLCTYQCRQMVKSEFLDTLSSTEKLVRDYQTKLETTNDNLHRAESEGKKYHDELLYAEQELAASRGREQALQEQLLKEINDSKERLKKQLHICSEAEGKLQKEINLRKTAESSAASAEEKANLFEQKLSHLSDSIEREKKHLKDELLQFQQESKLSVSRIRTDLERMECRANNAEKESAIYKEQLEAVKKQFRECLTQKSELENKLTMSSSPLKDSTETNSAMLVKQLQEELRNYESEVHEARKLRASYENIELLKEKLMEEKINRESAQVELLKLPEMQLAVEKLEDELLSWKKISQDIPGVSNPEDVVVKFSALQKEVLDSMAKLGETNSRLKQMEVALEEAEHVKRNFETDAAFTVENVGSLKSEVKHLEAMLSSVTGERDELRNAINRLKQENFEKGDVVSTGTLLQELESSLQKKDSYIKELENNLHEHKDACGRQCNEMRILSERLNSEAKRIKSSERENDRLRSEIALLESKLGHGDYSASSTKVLRMVNTLGVESEARQTLIQTKLKSFERESEESRRTEMEGKEEDVRLGANKYPERQPLGTSAQTKDYKEPPPAPLFEPGELSSWSFYRAGIAEFVATFLFLYISILTVMGLKRAPNMCASVGIQGIAWAFGGMIFALVYCTAGISGGHINPAVTFGLLLARKLSLTRAVFYMIMQCLGAICGAGVVKGFQPSQYQLLGGGANVVNHGYTKGDGLGAEIVGTFVLVYTVFSATDAKRSARDSHVPILAPLPIGFAVFLVHLATIPITGTGINPARSLGAAIIFNNSHAWSDHWIFWVGPFVGAALAALYHQVIIRAIPFKSSA